MPETSFHLANPPIIETVLDIDCDLPPDVEIAKLETVAASLLGDYPKRRKQYRQQVHANLINPEKTSVKEPTVLGLQFLQLDEKQLVQIRREGFSFNRLAPYKGFDKYRPEIERVWRIFLDVVKPRQIKAIKLRYINKIMLPTANQNVNLSDYILVGSMLPPAPPLSLMGFLNQYVAAEVETGNMASVVITSQPVQDDKLPVIFDITATCPNAMPCDDWAAIMERVQQLRLLKNSVFRNTLTQKCLSLFH